MNNREANVIYLCRALNRNFFRRMYPPSPLTSGFALRKLEYGLFAANELCPESAVIARVYAEMRIATEMPANRGAKYVSSIVVGEYMSFLCAQARLVRDANEARRKVVSVVRSYMRLDDANLQRNRISQYSVEAGAVMAAEIGIRDLPDLYTATSQFKTAFFGAAEVPLNPAPHDVISDAELDVALNILRVLAAGYFLAHPAYKITIFVEAYLAFTYSGTLTSVKSWKVATYLRVEIGTPIQLAKENVSQIYSDHKADISEARMINLVEELTPLFPKEALRLQLLLRQSEWTRLTAFVTIRRAFCLCPRFPWQRLMGLGVYAAEMRQFRNAYNMIHNRPYYGFNQELGIASSSHFRNLARVAALILNQEMGDRMIQEPQGIPADFVHNRVIKVWLQDMVNGTADNRDGVIPYEHGNVDITMPADNA